MSPWGWRRRLGLAEAEIRMLREVVLYGDDYNRSLRSRVIELERTVLLMRNFLDVEECPGTLPKYVKKGKKCES